MPRSKPRHPYPVTVINGDHDLAEFGNWYYSSKEVREEIPMWKSSSNE